MKNKKGFTLVELVIVIAVIAVLASVLIPTFAGILERTKENARLQQATSARDELISYKTLPTDAIGVVIKVEGYYYEIDSNLSVNPIDISLSNYNNLSNYIIDDTLSSNNITIYLPMSEEAQPEGTAFVVKNRILKTGNAYTYPKYVYLPSIEDIVIDGDRNRYEYIDEQGNECYQTEGVLGMDWGELLQLYPYYAVVFRDELVTMTFCEAPYKITMTVDDISFVGDNIGNVFFWNNKEIVNKVIPNDYCINYDSLEFNKSTHGGIAGIGLSNGNSVAIYGNIEVIDNTPGKLYNNDTELIENATFVVSNKVEKSNNEIIYSEYAFLPSIYNFEFEDGLSNFEYIDESGKEQYIYEGSLGMDWNELFDMFPYFLVLFVNENPTILFCENEFYLEIDDETIEFVGENIGTIDYYNENDITDNIIPNDHITNSTCFMFSKSTHGGICSMSPSPNASIAIYGNITIVDNTTEKLYSKN